MLKKAVYGIIVFLLIFYLIISVNLFGTKKNNDKCLNVSIEVLSKDDIPCLKSSKIKSFLDRFDLNPIGKNMSDINIKTIRNLLKKCKLIESIEIYKTIGSILKIKVQQRILVLRVLLKNADYYVDSNRRIISVSNNFVVCLPVATGNISEKYVKEQLSSFAIFLKKNTFWHSQIDQIYVYPNLEIELVPHVGNQLILLGLLNNFEKKMNNLQLFYERCLNTIGWNRYSTINLKYKNQIVCTKIN